MLPVCSPTVFIVKNFFLVGTISTVPCRFDA